MPDTKKKMATDCMAQHIKIFREQSLKDEKADFGRPCSECQYNHRCSFEWLEIMQPILEKTSVEINMVLTERN